MDLLFDSMLGTEVKKVLPVSSCRLLLRPDAKTFVLPGQAGGDLPRSSPQPGGVPHLARIVRFSIRAHGVNSFT